QDEAAIKVVDLSALNACRAFGRVGPRIAPVSDRNLAARDRSGAQDRQVLSRPIELDSLAGFSSQRDKGGCILRHELSLREITEGDLAVPYLEIAGDVRLSLVADNPHLARRRAVNDQPSEFPAHAKRRISHAVDGDIERHGGPVVDGEARLRAQERPAGGGKSPWSPECLAAEDEGIPYRARLFGGVGADDSAAGEVELPGEIRIVDRTVYGEAA